MKKPGRSTRLNAPLLMLAVLALAGMITAGVVAWQVWGTSWLAGQAAERRVTELTQQFAQAPAEDEAVVPRPNIGESPWLLRIAKLDLVWPIMAGVADEQLASGLGWYPGTAVPGQAGNFALAGQRVSSGKPFARLLELAKGDQVVIETKEATFTYTVEVPPGELTVAADAAWVLEPVPGKSDTEPVAAILTLTTAEDLFPTADRAVGFATLTAMEPR